MKLARASTLASPFWRLSSRTKTSIAYAALLVVALVAAVVVQPGGAEAPAILQYLGRLHILVLHVPIGVLVVALVGETLTLTKHRESGDVVVGLALPLLVLTGVVAIVLGLFLAHGETEHPLKLIAKHRNFTVAGIVIAGLAGIAFPYRRGRALHRVLLVASGVILGIGAHFGGSLTHGSEYLFAPVARSVPQTPTTADDAGAPTEIVAEAPVDAGVVALVIVDASVEASVPTVVAARDAGTAKSTKRAAAQAVLLRRCAPCHTDKTKGGLRVSDIGKMKAADVTAGDPGESLLYARLVLAKDSDDRMPPIEKPQPSAAELAVIRAWITELKTYP